MANAINKCSAEETAACCCVDVGTVMDNTDCSAAYSRVFADRDQAQQMQNLLTERARAAESDPCVIDSRLSDVADGVQLDMDFTFSCQAEALIFQLGLR